MSEALMRKVQEAVGGRIRQAVEGSKVPEAFLAALTANESAGDVKAIRHEPHVLSRLTQVALGERESYNGVTAGMLYPDPRAEESPVTYTKRVLRLLHDGATSWGWTQIMGYHLIKWEENPRDLFDPTLHYGHTLRLLRMFAADYQLDLAKDFEKMGRCWNTGKVAGKTYHENYIPNLLRRMSLWESTAHSPSAT